MNIQSQSKYDQSNVEQCWIQMKMSNKHQNSGAISRKSRDIYTIISYITTYRYYK